MTARTGRPVYLVNPGRMVKTVGTRMTGSPGGACAVVTVVTDTGAIGDNLIRLGQTAGAKSTVVGTRMTGSTAGTLMHFSSSDIRLIGGYPGVGIRITCHVTVHTGCVEADPAGMGDTGCTVMDVCPALDMAGCTLTACRGNPAGTPVRRTALGSPACGRIMAGVALQVHMNHVSACPWCRRISSIAGRRTIGQR